MPTPPDWATLDRALDHALDLDDDAREAFLASLDPPLREALAPLLRDALREDALLDHPAAALAALHDPGDAPPGGIAEGQRIGPYEIEALIGEGGMGRVYLARRADGTFDQTVAVKVVRASLALAGDDVAARLRRERDVLAALDHPSIARLLDGGTTQDGVPYLVTEFVDGAPITAWAEARALDVKARVRLMIDVARAVDHAHRRLVVHRDLKPSNVLVTERDGAARPVVLDFGIAKLLDAADGAGAFTQTGFRPLTPAYAAPELFDPASAVTTAADVYGLGALLYELLTGQRAHEGATGTATPPTEPKRPSQVVRQPSPNAAFDPDQQARALQGDLDTICLKALDPDPARRYVSAAALADDLARHLDGHPVEAQPDSLAYVAGRFVRRNRTASLATLAAVLALVVGLGIALASLASEREARATAEAETTRAERSARQANEVTTLLASLFDGANAELNNGRVLTTREALDLGLVRTRALDDDALRGYLFSVLGRTYWNIGEVGLGDSLMAEGVVLLDRTNADPAARATAHYYLARSKGSASRFDEALVHMRVAHTLAAQPLDDHDQLRFNITRDFAWLYGGANRLDSARLWAERAVQIARSAGDFKRQALALHELGNVYVAEQRYDQAIAAYEASIAAIRRSGIASEMMEAVIRGEMGNALFLAGRLDEAEAVRRRVLRDLRPVVGTRHPRIVENMHGLGETLLRQTNAREAEVYLDSALAIARAIGYAESPRLAEINALLAAAHLAQGQYLAAEAAARTAERIARETNVPATDPLWPPIWARLGLALRGQDRDRDARPLLERTVRAYDALASAGREAFEPGEIEAVRAALRTLGP